MAVQQLYKPILESPDLVDLNYKKALTSKVDELLKQYDVKKVETIKKKSIDRVVSDTALRRNKCKPHNLDQRCNSSGKYKEKGLLTGTTGTLEENLIPDLDYHEKYHDEQRKLIEELSRRWPETGFLKNTEHRKDEKGRWILYRNGKQLTRTKLLNFIDKITLKYTEQLSAEEKEGDLQTIVEFCQTIVMARYLADSNSDTDFMIEEQTGSWRKHVAVLLSFAALCVILEMLTLKGNRTIERTNEQSENPEQRPSTGNRTIERTDNRKYPNRMIGF